MSTQFSQLQKNQLIGLQDHLERYLNVLPVFGSNSAKYDNNSIKSYLLNLLVNERVFEPIVIRKSNQFVSFMFGVVYLLDKLSFLGGATSLDFFLKFYKTSETKDCFPHEWFVDPENLNNTQLPPYEIFFSKLRNNHLSEKNYPDFRRLIDGGLTSKDALSKLYLKQPPATGQESFQFFTCVWQKDNIRTFKDFCAGITLRKLFLC